VGDVESSVFDREPHGGGAGPQLLGDVEAALAALKGSAVFDREPQTVEAIERLTMAVTSAKIAQLRAALDEGRTAITFLLAQSVLYTSRESLRVWMTG
jgi:hypothetical protein